jgi:hypothetical protein
VVGALRDVHHEGRPWRKSLAPVAYSSGAIRTSGRPRLPAPMAAVTTRFVHLLRFRQLIPVRLAVLHPGRQEAAVRSSHRWVFEGLLSHDQSTSMIDHAGSTR